MNHLNFIIIGMGQFGRSLSAQLTQHGFDVTIIDRNKTIIDELKDTITGAAIHGDATDERLLRQLDLGEDTCVILSVGESFERNLLIAAQLKEMGVKRLYARSVNELQGRILELFHADLFRVEDVAAKQLALRFINEGLKRQRKIDSKHSLADVQLPESWVGKKLMEVKLREEYRLNLITVRRGEAVENSADDDVIVQKKEQPVIDDLPEPTMEFQEGDELVLYGKDSDLERFVRKFDL